MRGKSPSPRPSQSELRSSRPRKGRGEGEEPEAPADMLTLLFLLLFFGLLAAGMPIFLVLGMCAGILYIATGQPLIGAAQMVINKLNSTTLMALPLFVMAAAFMRSGGVAKALVDVATAWLGGIRGSLGLVTVVACTLFAAICGSS